MEDREIKMHLIELATAAAPLPKCTEDAVLEIAKKYWEFCISQASMPPLVIEDVGGSYF